MVIFSAFLGHVGCCYSQLDPTKQILFYEKKNYFVKKASFSIWGHGKLWRKILCYRSEKRPLWKPPKRLLWTWIFKNGANFLFIHCWWGKCSHLCCFNTYMLKVFHFCRNFKLSNLIFFQVSLGITYTNFIILGQKLGSRSQKSIFSKKIKNWWKFFKWSYIGRL